MADSVSAEKIGFRRPVAMVVEDASDADDYLGRALFVICDDGALFTYSNQEWGEIEPLPGSRRENERNLQALQEMRARGLKPSETGP